MVGKVRLIGRLVDLVDNSKTPDHFNSPVGHINKTKSYLISNQFSKALIKPFDALQAAGMNGQHCISLLKITTFH